MPQGELGCSYLSAGCEINLAQLPAGFGVASIANFDPDIKRMYNIETSVSVQHELLPRVSVSGGWFHRDFKNLRRRDNVLQSFADYTPFTLFSPIDGTPITYYNVSVAARSRVNTVDVTASSDRTLAYNGFEYSFNARLPRGLTMFGGGMSERTIGKLCDENWNPNLLLYCDQSKSGIPFRTQFKIAGTVPLKYAIAVSVSFQSLPGYRFGTAALNIDTGIVAGPSGQPGATSLANPNGQGTVWLITPTTRYTVCPGNSASQGCVVGALVDPGLNVASISVPLVAAADRIRRPHQSARSERDEDRQDRPRQLPAEDRLLQPVEPVFGLRRPHPQLRHHGVQPAFVDSGRPRVPAWSDREVLSWRP